MRDGGIPPPIHPDSGPSDQLRLSPRTAGNAAQLPPYCLVWPTTQGLFHVNPYLSPRLESLTGLGGAAAADFIDDSFLATYHPPRNICLALRTCGCVCAVWLRKRVLADCHQRQTQTRDQRCLRSDESRFVSARGRGQGELAMTVYVVYIKYSLDRVPAESME